MRTACFLLVLGMVGCAGSPTPAVEGGVVAPPSGSATLEKSPDSGQVDRVGPSDGALTPDGTNDLGFVARIDGPVAALFLVAVDDAGKPTGTFQADTLIGESESPAELGTKSGSGTTGLGVFEGEKALNRKDGALDAIAAGPHQLTLYVAPSGGLATGTKLRVYLQRPDKSLVAGGTVAN
jgi:hypothetical protein